MGLPGGEKTGLPDLPANVLLLERPAQSLQPAECHQVCKTGFSPLPPPG